MIDPKTIIENSVRIESLQADLKETQDSVKKLNSTRTVLATAAVILGISSVTLSTCVGTAFSDASDAKEMAAGAKDKINKLNALIEQAKTENFEPGMIISWHSDKPPSGWLMCDGEDFVSKDFSQLYKAITGKKLDKNSNEKTPTPNFSGRFLRGASDGDPAGDIVDAQVGSHWHPMFGGTGSVKTNGTPDSGTALKDGNFENEHAAYGAGKHSNSEQYEMKKSLSDGKMRARTYDNQSTGNWPDHVTVYFIIKHDAPKQDQQPTESD